jgi:hypothetical protein
MSVMPSVMASSLRAAIAWGACVGVAACGGNYTSRPFAERGVPHAAMRHLGCLDVWLAPGVRNDDLIVSVHMGNTCSAAVPVDLRRLEIFACRAGTRESFQVSDPRSEITELNVTPVTEGTENLRYRGPSGAPPELCADLSRIAPDAPSKRATMAFRREGDGAYTPTDEVCPCG